MRVKVSVTEEMTEDERAQLARLLDGQDARKRHASRDEARDFMWRHGASWREILAKSSEWAEELDAQQLALVDDDLIGTSDGMDLI